MPEAVWVAELVREQLLAATHEELPYSIATQRDGVGVAAHPGRDPGRAGEPEGDGHRQGRRRAEGRSGTAARAQLPEGVFLELHVTVDKDWQRRPDRIARLGY